jgi:carbonic anhydrase
MSHTSSYLGDEDSDHHEDSDFISGVKILDTEITEALDAQLSITEEDLIKNSIIKRSLSTSFKKSTSIGEVEDFRSIEKDDNNYKKLFDGNRSFVASKLQSDPEYFMRLSKSQSPKYVLIGCADSRVPPDQLTQTEPGEIFIHRNGKYNVSVLTLSVANLVVNTDLNCMSVIQYAVEVLKVKHVIVMGHYGCGGVKASMEKKYHGLIDNWLRNIKDVQRLHWQELQNITNESEKFRRLVELNVKEQALNVCKTAVVQKAWSKGENVHVHGWVYDLESGIIKDLEIEQTEWFNIKPIYEVEITHGKRK